MELNQFIHLSLSVHTQIILSVLKFWNTSYPNDVPGQSSVTEVIHSVYKAIRVILEMCSGLEMLSSALEILHQTEKSCRWSFIDWAKVLSKCSNIIVYIVCYGIPLVCPLRIFPRVFFKEGSGQTERAEEWDPTSLQSTRSVQSHFQLYERMDAKKKKKRCELMLLRTVRHISCFKLKHVQWNEACRFQGWGGGDGVAAT